MQLPRFILQESNLVEKSWGGEWLAKLKGVENNRKIGESWEFSTHPSRPSYVWIRGRKISLLDLLKAAGKEIVGKEANSLPVLVKLLDINTRISVQVHPSDEVARLLGEKEPGKDEAWLILDCGRVYIGFKERANQSDLPQPRILEKMHKFDAEYLDSFKIPAGMIHYAEKVKTLEVSSNSNLTYRIYDFAGRETQLDKAIKALNFEPVEPESVGGEKGKIEMGKFGAEILEVDGVMEARTKGFSILIVLKGEVILKSGEERVELKHGNSCLVPAFTKVFEIEGDKSFVCRVFSLN